MSVPFHIPVLLLHFFPARRGCLDIRVTGDVGGSLDAVRRHTQTTTEQVIRALEAGSAYHGYRDRIARASLRYEIVHSIEFLEPLPTWRKPGHAVPMTDYNAIASQADLARWVSLGVKEVWLWGYHGGVIDLWESNMAGPHGDVSNSDRDGSDLPVYDSTYTFYHYNYGRGASEAVEDHMHQIESLLGHVDEEMFWHRFVGAPGEGRCGWSHVPPNGERDYDWANPRFVPTDIENWTPDGSGPKWRTSAARWNGDSLAWFQFWMQNVPGHLNGLKYLGRPLSNWWQFVGDWDGAMARGARLVER